jgi:hypothetical protein
MLLHLQSALATGHCRKKEAGPHLQARIHSPAIRMPRRHHHDKLRRQLPKDSCTGLLSYAPEHPFLACRRCRHEERARGILFLLGSLVLVTSSPHSLQETPLPTRSSPFLRVESLVPLPPVGAVKAIGGEEERQTRCQKAPPLCCLFHCESEEAESSSSTTCTLRSEGCC